MIKQRVSGIDGLRVIAIMAVVLIHTTTRTLERTSYNLTAYSWSLFLNQIVRFAVPLFFIISGFVLEMSSNSDLNYFIFIKKRFSKILIPYIFWSLIYYYFIYNQNSDNLIRVFLTGNASYQLYFIPTLCIFYLIFPIFHKFYRFIASPIALSSLAVLQIYLLHHDYFTRDLPFVDPIRISLLGFFFFIIGIVAARHKDVLTNFSKKWKIVVTIFFGALGYYIFREGLSNYQTTYNIHAFYSSWRPSIFLYALLSPIFLLTTVSKVNFEKLSRLSFLVFFIHIIVLEMVWKCIGGFVNPNVYFDLGFFIIVIGISFLTSSLIHKIPHISKIVG